MDDFWSLFNIDTQDEFIDVEYVNPADAYRKQAEAINFSGPLYADLEYYKKLLERVNRVERELKARILAQAMPVPSSSTRTTDLVEAFLLAQAKDFTMPDGSKRDVSENLVRLWRRRSRLEERIDRTHLRLKALTDMAERCDSILNWAKHEARLELGRG